jgi:signal transduction histidine kinase
VSSKDNQAEAVINVVDSGEGIHHEIIPRLFTKFASRSNSGTGLCLYISKSIVAELRLVSVYLLVKISNKLRTLRMP